MYVRAVIRRIEIIFYSLHTINIQMHLSFNLSRDAMVFVIIIIMIICMAFMSPSAAMITTLAVAASALLYYFMCGGNGAANTVDTPPEQFTASCGSAKLHTDK